MVHLPQISWTVESHVISIVIKLKHAPECLDSTLSSEEDPWVWPNLKTWGVIPTCPPSQQGDEQGLKRSGVRDSLLCTALEHLHYLASVDLSGLPPSSPAWHGLAHGQCMGFSSELLVFLFLWFTPGSHMAWLGAGVYFCQHIQIYQY